MKTNDESSIRQDIVDQFGGGAETILFADGFDDAIMGVGSQFGQDLCVVYDTDKVINILMEQGMDYAEAMEHFDFNIAGSYVGSQTPIFMYKTERNTK